MSLRVFLGLEYNFWIKDDRTVLWYCCVGKVSKISSVVSDVLNLGVYEYTYPPPPPFLERGTAEFVFRQTAYVPLSEINPSRSSVVCEVICLAIVFFEMHCIPSSWNFYALHVGYLVGTWSNDFYDLVGSFPVCSKFSRISLGGVLEDFAKNQLSFVEYAIPYVGIIIFCGCMLVILHSDECSVSALVDEVKII